MKKIGTITLNEIAFLSDPCYDMGVWCCGGSIKVVSGEYDVFITRSKSKDPWFKGRISNLIAIHKDYLKNKKLPKTEITAWCGVDSGTCGIFDIDYYEKYHADELNEEWYQKFVCGEICDKSAEYRICDGLGVWSSSGCGDGQYPVFCDYIGDKAYAIRIKYL